MLSPSWFRRHDDKPTLSFARRRGLANVLLVVAAVVTVALVVVAVGRGGSTDESDGRPGSPTFGVPSQVAVDPDASPPVAQPASGPLGRLGARVQNALAATRFPKLRPSVEALGTTAWAKDAERSGCINALPADADCTSGPADSPDTVVVLGDTIATAYLPALKAALGKRFRIQALTLQECPVWDAPVTHVGGAAYPDCDTFRKSTWSQVRRLKPDVLVMATSWQSGDRLASGATGGDAVDEVVAGYERSLTELVPSARLAVVLSAPPGGAALQTCLTRGATPADCVSDVPDAYSAVVDAERDLSEQAGAIYVDTESWFCAGGSCPGFVGSTPVYADGVHLTSAYAGLLAPVMLDALVKAGDEIRSREGGAG